VLGDRPRARVLIEASTESEWVARCLEELGHEVVVADPNYAPMYAQRSRRVCELELPRHLKEEIAPLLALLGSLNVQISACDRRLV
jgi:hypothetical protein